jgi:hypothetical protein
MLDYYLFAIKKKAFISKVFSKVEPVTFNEPDELPTALSRDVRL